jgi:hypothetical protein
MFCCAAFAFIWQLISLLLLPLQTKPKKLRATAKCFQGPQSFSFFIVIALT